MFNINLSITNPWSNRFENIRSWSGSTFFKFKFWELQLYKSSDVVRLCIDLTHKQDHAGLKLELGLVGVNAEFVFYDSRHFDYEADRWIF
jgi:hypothetical protein